MAIVQQGCQDHSMGERVIFSTNSDGKLDIHMQQNEAGSLPQTIYKKRKTNTQNQLKN